MMYPFMTLDDGTEIVHSEYLDNGEVKVYAETPDEEKGFLHMTVFLPSYRIEEIYGYDEGMKEKIMDVISSTSHLIIEFSRNGGFEHASGF